eukprot:1453038-Amphidinium_carterae.1
MARSCEGTQRVIRWWRSALAAPQPPKNGIVQKIGEKWGNFGIPLDMIKWSKLLSNTKRVWGITLHWRCRYRLSEPITASY